MADSGIGSIQRVLAALEHREPDRVPLDIGGTRASSVDWEAYHEYRRGLGLPKSNPGEQIRYLRLPKVEQDFRDAVGADLECVDPNTAVEEGPYQQKANGDFYVDRWGTEWFRPTDAHYYDARTFPLADVQTPADIERFAWPKEDSEAMLANIQNDTAVIWSEHRRAVELGRTCPGIFEMLCILCGLEKAMTDMSVNVPLVEAIMDRMLEQKIIYYQAAIERVLAAGVDYFFIEESEDLGSQRGLLMSPEMYRRFVKPRHTALFDAIRKVSKGKAFIGLHSCGAIRELIPDFIESGVQILNPIQLSAEGMDTSELKNEFGDSIVFHGGAVDTQHTLVKGTPQQIRDEVKRNMDALAPGGGFIFTPVHSIQYDVSFENFMAMLETFREYV